jgi:RNA polymerase sigma-70 factor (ECF subfamily)
VPSVNPTTLASAEEAALVRRAQAGDRAAQADVVERYWERIYRWLYRLTRDRHTAEDLAQESLLRAFARLDSFEPGTNLGAWLFRIAHNALANHYRANRRRKALPSELADRSASPDRLAGDRERLHLMQSALDKLSPEFRAALLLRAEEGLSFHEIAQIVGTTEETARWRVFKARRRLMKLLEPEEDREES